MDFAAAGRSDVTGVVDVHIAITAGGVGVNPGAVGRNVARRVDGDAAVIVQGVGVDAVAPASMSPLLVMSMGL